MTRTRLVKGTITERTGGNEIYYAEGNIVINAGKSINITTVDGISFGEPEINESIIKSEISVKILKGEFLPLGISNFKGEIENNTIKFEVRCKKGIVERLTFLIKHNGKEIHRKQLDNSLKSGDKIEVEWDGFSDTKIYDSTFFTDGELTIEVTGADNEAKDIFKSKYNKGKWVDVKIDDNIKIIDVILRVNLSNGRIDSDVTKSLSDLISMGLLGLEKYWGRNKTRTIGNSLNINGNEYEVFIKPLNTEENSMPSLRIYASTKKYGRSRNWILSRKLFYNSGYYPSIQEDDEDYSHTAAHEIGHEILQCFGGKLDYSYVHKDSSTLLTQKVVDESVFPISGEIDLMKYYSDDSYYTRLSNNFFERNVAAETDVKGLLWCSILKIK